MASDGNGKSLPGKGFTSRDGILPSFRCPAPNGGFGRVFLAAIYIWESKPRKSIGRETRFAFLPEKKRKEGVPNLSEDELSYRRALSRRTTRLNCPPIAKYNVHRKRERKVISSYNDEFLRSELSVRQEIRWSRDNVNKKWNNDWHRGSVFSFSFVVRNMKRFNNRRQVKEANDSSTSLEYKFFLFWNFL